MPRISVYAGPPIAAALASCQEGERSARLNDIAERYAAVVRADCPTLREREWLYLCDMLNGTILQPPEVVGHIPEDVEEADELDGLGAKWNVQPIEFADKLRTLTFGELMALAEVVQSFWRLPPGTTTDDGWRGLLQAAGAKIASDG